MAKTTSQSEYNHRFLDRLQRRRPDLLDKVEKVIHDGVECIKIEIPPSDGQKDAIVITTCDTELTMFYHVHHIHFDMFEEDDEQSEFDNLFDYIESFETEFRVMVFVFDGERLCGSWDTSSDGPIEPTPNRKVIVRSWKGTYSRTIE